jgi:hypothetical protein
MFTDRNVNQLQYQREDDDCAYTVGFKIILVAHPIALDIMADGWSEISCDDSTTAIDRPQHPGTIADRHQLAIDW